MKRLLLLLALFPAVASAQFSAGRSLKQLYGMPWGQFVTATDTAKDNAVYYHGLNYDIGGGSIYYGITIADSCNSINPNLVLAYSADSTTWTEVDSVAVTPELEATTWKYFDADLISAPYWRLRFCAGAAGDSLRGVVADGDFTFFIRIPSRE